MPPNRSYRTFNTHKHIRRFLPPSNKLPVGCSSLGWVRIREGFQGNSSFAYLREESYGSGVSVYTLISGDQKESVERQIVKKHFDIEWKDAKYTLSRTRYLFFLEKRGCSLDVFHEKLEGYAQIEVGFRTVREAKAFVPPPWFGKEVTYDKECQPAHLAEHGVPR